jgi:hypothetical protein
MMRVHRHAAAIVLAWLSFAAPAFGHALASTIVSVAETRPGLIEVTVEAEADALIAKLEALSGAPASQPPATREERRARLESLWPSLRAHIEARVNGQPVVFELRDTTVDDTAQAAIHLRAKTPAGRHEFTWRSTFVFGAYRLATKDGRDADVIQWLQGPQTSAPITLAATSALRVIGDGWLSTRIGHGLAVSGLVVFVLVRRRRGQRLAGG